MRGDPSGTYQKLNVGEIWPLPAFLVFPGSHTIGAEHEDTCGIPESCGQMFKNKRIFVNAANAFLQISKPFFSLTLEKKS